MIKEILEIGHRLSRQGSDDGRRLIDIAEALMEERDDMIIAIRCLRSEHPNPGGAIDRFAEESLKKAGASLQQRGKQ